MTVQEAKAQRLLQKLKRHTSKMYGYEMALSEIEICKKALEELEQYRALGTVEELKEAREKQVAKKPIVKDIVIFDCIQEQEIVCPICKSECGVSRGQPYCENCGQKIDWEEGTE